MMSEPLPPTPHRSPQTPLEWALFYASLGWSVVPVRRGEKIPAERWARFQTLPADHAQIMAWFAENPTFGVGLIQGGRSATIVLDFDAASGGLETLAELDARGLPQSVRQFTPGGGVHVLLRHPGRYVPTRKSVRAGMDVRGDGGFIVATPSVHANGREYAWDVDAHPEETPVADCPAWLVDLICGDAPQLPGTPGEVVRVQAAGPLGVPTAERITDGREQYMRDTILAVCRDLRDRLGRLPDEGELFDAAWPQYAAKVDFTRAGRGEAEFRAKVRYTLGRIHAGAVRGFGIEPAQSGETRRNPAELDRLTYDPETGEILSEAAGTPGTPGTANPAPTLPLIYFSDVKPNLDAADFVEGLLIEGAMSVIYGPSNCGKTFFMTDLALHVAAGQPWRSKEVEHGGVIYCALEGSHGISNRIAAFKKERGLEGVELPFAVVPVSINLLDPDADRAKLVATIQAAAATMGLPVKMAVIDTLSRALSGGNENAPDDMGALVASADYIRQSVKAHLAFIHHSGKDQAQGARGHSLLRAATDTEIEISRPDNNSPSVARVTKQRELEIEGTFAFNLKTVELGTNRRGKPVTSCVVEPVEAGQTTEAKRPLPKTMAVAMTALHQALIKAGQPGTERDMPGTRVVHVDVWRQEFYARQSHKAPDARRKSFQRAVDDLAMSGRVGVLNGHAWDTSTVRKDAIQAGHFSGTSAGQTGQTGHSGTQNSGTNGTWV